jgi:hypothetical protein
VGRKRERLEDLVSGITEENRHPEILEHPISLGGSLVERARTAAFMNAPSSICPLLNELAGEVERLSGIEATHNELVNDFTEARLRWADKIASVTVDKNAEIERIKSTVDTTAIQNAFYRGFVTAAKQLTSVINTLVMADSHGRD